MDLPAGSSAPSQAAQAEMMDRDWKNLPIHLLDSVVGRLVLLRDYLRFSLVCKSWYGIAVDNQAQRSKMTSPMLLIGTNKEDTWKLYDPMEDKVFDVDISIPNKRYSGCSKGWLITVEDNFSGVTLINPFLRVQGSRKKENSIIRLPSLPPPSKLWTSSTNYDHYVFKSAISADPIVDPNNCVIVVIYEAHYRMAFLRLGKDTTWTLIDGNCTQEVIHFDGRFYALDLWSKISCFEITAQSFPDIKSFKHDIGIEHAKRYLVISNEKKVLMVRRYYEFEDEDDMREDEFEYYMGEDDGKRFTTGFRIFEFNFEKCEWFEKFSLGDVALFLGDNCTVSVPVSDCSGLQSNCIYFNHDIVRDVCPFDRTGDHHSSDFGVYNVETQSISQSYCIHATTLVKNTKCPPIWVVPPFQL
ncbi:hypothetical protein ACLB2K_014453 [Fragaria x ananassa]